MSNYTTNNKDSATEVKEFYDRYFVKKISYPASEVDAVYNFFTKRNFDEQAARAVSSILLEQAKLDNIKVFKLLDTLKGLSKIQLSAIVTEILNYKRPRSSTLGYRVENQGFLNELRNIVV